MSRILGKYLKANQTVDGIRGGPGRLQLPSGRVRFSFGFLMKRGLSTEFFDDLKSTPRQTNRSAEGAGGILF